DPPESPPAAAPSSRSTTARAASASAARVPRAWRTSKAERAPAAGPAACRGREGNPSTPRGAVSGSRGTSFRLFPTGDGLNDQVHPLVPFGGGDINRRGEPDHLFCRQIHQYAAGKALFHEFLRLGLELDPKHQPSPADLCNLRRDPRVLPQLRHRRLAQL